MKYLPSEARVVLIDGPVAIFISDGEPGLEILEAYKRLARGVHVAAVQMEEIRQKKERHGAPNPIQADRSLPESSDDRRGGAGEV